MSVIAIKGIPNNWTLADMAIKLKRLLKGHEFDPLNFQCTKSSVLKTCYVRLSPRLDPIRIVEKINTFPNLAKKSKLIAFIPESVPNLPMPKALNKLKKNKVKVFKSMKPHEVIVATHHEIMIELQTKFPELYNISCKTGHKLLEEIALVIYERLKPIMLGEPKVRQSCFLLSQAYRRLHPHFGDFQLILSTLHLLQDNVGAPRLQISEAAMTKYVAKPFCINSIPSNVVVGYCNKYNDHLTKVIRNHLDKLTIDPAGSDDQQIARNRVREEMKKMSPYISTILNQLSKKYFVPQGVPNPKVCIYGEPFLPNKTAMQPFVARYNSPNSRIMRSRRMFNLLKFNVPHNKFNELIAMDGTILNGAKLWIRGELPHYEISDKLRHDMLLTYGGELDYVVGEEVVEGDQDFQEDDIFEE